MKLALLILLPAFASLAQQPKFDVADVHISSSPRMLAQSFGGVLREGRYVNRDVTMLKLIAAAYDVSEDDIAGGPGWLSSELFDVVAKVPDGATAATANSMLRSLLAERFGLVIQKGSHPSPRYVMTTAKGGSKLKPASGSDATGCQPRQQTGGNPADLASLPNIKVACHNLTATAIAESLHQMAGGYLDHEVVDSTKLEGSWDFDLEWTSRGALAAKGADGISVFEAVERQLGLKLDLQNIPMPSLVVEKINRKPTENPAGVATALAVAAARFEAAAIKPANPDQPALTGLLYTGGSQMRAGGTLRALIAMSLQVSPNLANDVVVGLPKSADSQRWEITAKVPSTGEGAPNIVGGRPMPPPLSVGLEMLRGLLLDQFELKTHSEKREVTVYLLTAARGKPKLTQADESERSGCKPDNNAPRPAKNVTLLIGCRNTTMAELSEILPGMATAYLDHPVVDATGLEGGWDFLIAWTPKGMLQATPPPSPSSQSAGLIPEARDPNGITIFEALDKELGLKLVKDKRTIPVIVVDHVSEKPVE